MVLHERKVLETAAFVERGNFEQLLFSTESQVKAAKLSWRELRQLDGTYVPPRHGTTGYVVGREATLGQPRHIIIDTNNITMYFRRTTVTPKSCQLQQHLYHVLHVGMQATMANTRSNRPVRVSTDFALVPPKSTGHTPLELFRSAEGEASLMTAISTQRLMV